MADKPSNLITCPQCGKGTYAKGAFCSHCGKTLAQPATPAAAPAATGGTPPTNPPVPTSTTPTPVPQPAKSDAEKWNLEVTTTGGASGQYNLAIQVTKNGKGEKSKVYVAIGNQSNTHSTDKNGFLNLPIAVTQREVRLTVGVIGTQANLEKPIVLSGCKPKVQGGFWANVLARRDFHKKS